MNIKECEQYLLEKLCSIYKEFSFWLTKEKLETPYFQFYKTETIRTKWTHCYNDVGVLIVTIPLESMDRYVILENMVHLIIHLYDQRHYIEDMSATNNGAYHRKGFQSSAEYFGIQCRRSNVFGYEIEIISKEIRKEGQKIIDKYSQEMKIYKKMALDQRQKKNIATKQSYVTYRCPICEKKIKATENSMVLCGICGSMFVRL